MKSKLYYFLLLLCTCSSVLKAESYLQIINPDNTWNSTYGVINDIQIDITPNGLYAQIELTFKISPSHPIGASNTQPLEAIMNFELPANSYIHNSWLWLDDNTIIEADIIEKEKAVAIYEGIVRRKRDPSILYHVGKNQYEFHVYPMFNKVARKVKIVYSTPFIWRGNRAYVNYPVGLLTTAYEQQSAIVSTIHHNAVFTNPSLEEAPINNYITSTTANSISLNIPASTYNGNRDINLYYTTNASEPLVFNYPISANEGYYQVAAPAIAPKAPKHIAVLIDNSEYWRGNPAVSFSDIKRHLATYLITNYNENDSFNLFYVHGTTTVQASQEWLPMSNSTILNKINAIPASINSDYNQFMDAIGKSYAFCKMTNDADLVILTTDPKTYTDSTANKAIGNIRTVAGNFDYNKIYVINYAAPYYSNSGPVGGQVFLEKLANITKGAYFHYLGAYYDANTRKYNYEFDIAGTLHQIAMKDGYETNAYTLDMPLGGIIYSEYDINGLNKLNLQYPYLQTGKYYGSFPSAGSIQLSYLSPGGLVTQQSNFTGVHMGSENVKRGWIKNYIDDLVARGKSYYQEALDSSINNRVLCKYTAFLALETGDTVNGQKKDDGPIPTSTNNLEKQNAFRIYPNPFTDVFTIESGMPIDKVEVYDLLGRLHYTESNISKNKLSIHIHTLASGFYFIKIFSGTDISTVKVQKL